MQPLSYGWFCIDEKSIYLPSQYNWIKLRFKYRAVFEDIEWSQTQPFLHSIHKMEIMIWYGMIILICIPGGPKKTEHSNTVDFSGLCSVEQLSFLTLLDRASFPQNNNTKIIKFGWELFILWVISYGLSFSGFARFPEFRGMINDNLMANPENDSP